MPQSVDQFNFDLVYRRNHALAWRYVVTFWDKPLPLVPGVSPPCQRVEITDGLYFVVEQLDPNSIPL